VRSEPATPTVPEVVAAKGSAAVAAPRPTPNLPPPVEDDGPIGFVEEDEPDPDAPFVANSDEFYAHLDEVYGRRLRGYAAPCYQGGHDRKGKVRLLFTWKISGGAVSVANVRVDETTLGDAKLEACMVKAVAAAHWTDPRMPDWATHPGEEERLLIRIENLKRFASEK
jgi:hypothetical protein